METEAMMEVITSEGLYADMVLAVEAVRNLKATGDYKLTEIVNEQLN